MGTHPIQPSSINTEFFSAVNLEEMNVYAKLQTRIDRKYIVTPNICNALLAGLDIDGSVLEINGHRTNLYQSIYFD